MSCLSIAEVQADRLTKHNIADVMGESKVLLCRYRYLEHVIVKTRRTQNSTLLLLPVPDNSAFQFLVMPNDYIDYK